MSKETDPAPPPRTSIYGNSQIGEGTILGEGVIIGHPGKDDGDILASGEFHRLPGARIGAGCIIRAHSIIYSKTELKDRVKTGHFSLVREESIVGEGTLIGTGTIIEDQCIIGSDVSIQSGVYIPTFSKVADKVFLGPNCVLTNDDRMGRGEWKLQGITIEYGARIGANSTIRPGITIGRDAVVGAGSVVTKDVEPYTVVVGVPARRLKDVAEKDRLL